ncbi:MAG TPA: protein-L-isoaspartate(D-aspartate) O-methyltransferase [Flavisolibacter sp.]|nr:protein-L-isoaspartate(D-aspartate) O-methyltransferase [Flavisolibacter sp.]
MENYEDIFVYKKLRERLVQGLRNKGITNNRVLEVIGTIPRQFFMPADLQNKAYEDRAFPIGEGQTISQPYTVAYQTQLLEVQPHHRILEIGTGSAYQAAILALLASEVFSIERQKKLFEKNRQFLYIKSFSNLHLFYGDGYEGLPHYAPFDRILITAAAPFVPPKLVDQLKWGGKMVLPLGKESPQRMVRITKLDNDQISQESFSNFSFVPMLEGKKE